MKRKVFSGILSLIALTILIDIKVYSYEIPKFITVDFNKISIKVNSSAVNADNFLYNSTTYVPLRTIAEMLGKKVEWDEKNRSINICSRTFEENTPEIKYPLNYWNNSLDEGSQEILTYFNLVNIYVDNLKVSADNILYKNTTYIPMRTISEMLGKAVEWDEATFTANISNQFSDKSKMRFNSARALQYYLVENFSQLKNDMYNLDLSISVLENTNPLEPQDYKIDVTFGKQPNESGKVENELYNLLKDKNIKYTREQKDSYRKELCEHMNKISETALIGIPDKKFKGRYIARRSGSSTLMDNGGYHYSRDEIVFYYSWTNYDLPPTQSDSAYKTYKSIKPGTFRWVSEKFSDKPYPEIQQPDK